MIRSLLITDSSFNMVMATSMRLRSSSFISESSRPTLLNYTLDLETITLRLQFDTTIQQAIDRTNIYFSSENSTCIYTILASYYIDSNDKSNVIHNLAGLQPLGECLKCLSRNISLSLDDGTHLSTGNLLTLNASSITPSQIIQDSTPPQLITSILNLNNGTSTLCFDESIDKGSVDTGAIVFYSDSTMAAGVQLTGGLVINPECSACVQLNLTFPDLVQLKFASLSYLVVLSAFARDTAGNIFIGSAERQRITILTADTSPPLFLGFSIDLNDGQFNVTFNDVININSLEISAFTFQDAPTANISYTLSTFTNVTTYDNYTVVIYLNPLELIDLKTLDGVGTDINDTFLTLAASAIDDIFGEDVVAVTDGKGIQATVVVEDTTPPDILSFNLDMNKGILSLVFSDSMDLNTFNISGLTLQNAVRVTNTMDYFVLTGGNVRRSFTDTSILEVDLTENDLNEIKQNENLATSEATTYLSVASETGVDAASNPLNAIPRTNAQQVNTLINDTTAPILRRYDLNLDNGFLTLSFSETIRLSTFEPSGITLLNSRNISVASEMHQLTSGTVLGLNGPVVEIVLSPFDLNTLKSMFSLATTIGDTYLAMAPNAFSDMRFNPVMNLPASEALRANSVSPDITRPILYDFSIDLNSGTLTFNFSEFVNPASFNPMESQLQSEADSANVSLQLSGGIPSSSLDVLTVILSEEDLYELQNETRLAVSASTTFFSASANFVTDASGNMLFSLSNTSALAADLLTPDIESPILEDFLLNLDQGVIVLTFNEVVNVQSLDISQIILQSTPTATTNTSFLSLNNSVALSFNHYIITVILSDEDKERIDVDFRLAINENTTYVNITIDGVQDMSANPIDAFNQSVPVGTFIGDSTGPQITDFSLDLDSGIFDIFFSEAITNFRLQDINITTSRRNLPIAPTIHILDTTQVPMIGPQSVLSIQISSQDLNALKFDPVLSSNNDSQVVYLFNSFSDVYGNPTLGGIVSHPPGPDRNRPAVLGFDLDMDTGNLLLTFNETVEIQSLDLTAVTIQNEAMTPTSFVQLSTPDNVVLRQFSVIEVDLSILDTNRIKTIQDLAVNASTTFISVAEGFVNDTALPLPNVNVETLGLPVNNYTSDTTDIQFLRFDLNLTSNTLILYFDEPAEISSFDETTLTLLDIRNTNFSFSFARGQLPLMNTKTVEIQLDQADVNILNILPICRSSADCYLNLTDDVAVDTSGNPVNFTTEIPVQVDVFYRDMVRPQLTQFQELDLNTGQLTILFSETVSVRSVIPSSLNLTNWYENNDLRTITLSLDNNASVISTNGPLITIQLSRENLNILKLPTNDLCKSRQSCWLRFDMSFLQDAFGNPVQSIIDSGFIDAEFVDNIVPDTTPPMLLSFNLDMNSTTISFTFDEVISDDDLFNPRVVTIQDAFNRTSSISLINTASDSLIIPSLPTELILNISDTDSISLQENLVVATSINSSWLSYSRSFVADVALNRIESAIDGINTTVASGYILDAIRPQVITFSELSYVSNTFSVVFSEPVLVNSYVPSLFTIRSGPQGPIEYNLTSGNASLVPNSRTLQIRFAEFDVTELKRTDGITNDGGTTYILISDGAVTDTAGNPVIGTRDNFNNPIGIMVDSYEQDVVPPTLVCFSLDLNIGFIQLTFNDVIDPDTFIPQELTLIEIGDFAASLPENQLRFTAGSSPSPNGFIVNFTIPIADLNAIKQRDQLATNYSDTFITARPLVIMDTSGQPANPATLQVCDFTPDITPPFLANWTYDATNGAISLLFSEAVNITSLMPNGIILQNSDNLASRTQYYTLTGGRTFPNITDVMFQLFLTFEDLSNVQERTNLLTSINNSYLALMPASILDQSGNEVIGILETSALQALDHDPDLMSPRLQDFTFDLNEGSLLLTFSESVNVSSFNTSLFTFANDLDPTAANFVQYTLTGGEVVVNDTELAMMGMSDHDVVVKLTLTSSDLNAIKARESLATTRSNTRLFFNQGAVTDANKNSISEVLVSNSYVALEFTNDTTEPELVAFDVNLNNGEVLLAFSETVRAQSLNFTGITFLDHNVNNTVNYTLTGGNVTSRDGPNVYFTLSKDDINQLKTMPEILTRRRNTYILVDSSAIVDTSGNSVRSIPTLMAIRVNIIVRDITPPELEASILDLNSGNLTLSFTESVLVSSLDTTALTVTNGQPGTSRFTLTNSMSASMDGPIVVVELSRSDLNSIKMITDLAVNPSSSYIFFTDSLIMDTSLNPVINISSEQAVLVTQYIPDTTSPALMGFDLALTDSIRRPLLIDIQFSETINASSISVTSFTLQSAVDATAPGVQSYTLTGGNVTQIDDDTVEIAVLDNDFETIIYDLMFLTSPDMTFLSIGPGAGRDNSNFDIVTILNTMGVQVRMYDVDLVSPEVREYSLDMDIGVLSITWSENVLAETLIVNAIYIQNDSIITDSFHRLTNATVTIGANMNITHVLLSSFDLNMIKSDINLASNFNNTYLAINMRGAIFDLASNPLLGLFRNSSLPPTEYIPDETRPILEEFDFMLTTRILTLYFSESVLPSSLNIDGITLQNRNRQPTEGIALTSGNTSSNAGSVIRVSISNDDINRLKQRENLFTAEDNSYLAIASFAITDTAGNPVITIAPSDALRVSDFNNDTRPPTLESFELNFNSRQLVLTFSETVNVTSLNVTGLTLHNEISTSPAIAYSLTDSFSDSVDGPEIVVTLSNQDFNEITPGAANKTW